MEQSMNLAQISANARNILHDLTIQKKQEETSRIETVYRYLVATHREHVVRTLISRAMKGQNQCYINFDRRQVCQGIGRPTDVLRETLIRIINSDPRLVGVTISVWNNAKNTVHFWW